MARRPKATAYILLSIVILSLLLTTSCLESTRGAGVGGVIIDAPRKNFKAEIYGKILSPDGVIANARVEVPKYDLKGVSDSEGNYSFKIATLTKLGVNRVRVLVKAKKEGYQQRTKGVYVKIRERAQLNITLIPKKY
jgi:hypothetical protein